MFHKRFFSTVLTAAVLFSITFVQGFTASRNITSLKLDFLRTEEILENNQTTSMSGTIIYNKNPFVFVFKLKTPVEQILYVNDDNAFILEGGTDGKVYDIAENKDFLIQTCTDFLNWFKSDYGLTESYFRAGDKCVDRDQIITQWDCYNFENQPLNKVLVWSDSEGRFTKLMMYVNGNTLVTETNLSSFKSDGGTPYPTTINSTSYAEDVPFMKMELKLSNVSFVLSKDDILTIDTLADQAAKKNIELPKNDRTKELAAATPSVPQQVTYRVSLPSVLVSTSFSFYKKFITSQDMSNCPFYPSCSQFMLDAVSANGLFGFFQGIERLKRCTSTEHARGLYPTLSNGKHYDPVPVMNKD